MAVEPKSNLSYNRLINVMPRPQAVSVSTCLAICFLTVIICVGYIVIHRYSDILEPCDSDL